MIAGLERLWQLLQLALRIVADVASIVELVLEIKAKITELLEGGSIRALPAAG